MEAGHAWGDLIAERARDGIQQYEVAAELRMSRTRFSVLESSRGETTPTPEFAERYLAAVRAIAQRRAEAVAS